ncbi:hypothetical protein [uncultured Tateyamaria sp.]|uniref:hypothetical protein n=1 Tax=uncultured Tateyamaria sp. TaxID=455651 RepID=UPI0026127529|nr:hypothetical protein [uncultured Tateyamaria sp.]
MALTEKDMMRRVQEIEAAIADLEAEKRALHHLLYSTVAKERASEIHDKRSYKRIYHEERIRLALQNNRSGMTLKQLSGNLLRQGISIKDSTLRSHLSRMAKRGLVSNDRSTHRWRTVTV